MSLQACCGLTCRLALKTTMVAVMQSLMKKVGACRTQAAARQTATRLPALVLVLVLVPVLALGAVAAMAVLMATLPVKQSRPVVTTGVLVTGTRLAAVTTRRAAGAARMMTATT